ncbi:MAG: ElyC/SanA/YdcF family protein [Alphaproteobacteria bacterium]|mgnify:CR=1 FL=1|jgi:uncharacterized SAM-binding protein YcdF (DUF218 family)|nr:ElyC/SanA/YdcF family protein [Alphaproteobacteria bacterium]MDP6812739.1 ElyC/SanA/YdcF family protein [Alphaproteobacteria bacterium]|tara:strand:- start:229 stop:846 length:618 start_codon:yes stop_codon:yes gene_type:complete
MRSFTAPVDALPERPFVIRPYRWIFPVLAAASIAVLLAGVGLVGFWPMPAEHAEASIHSCASVFTGREKRIHFAMGLLAEGRIERLFLSGTRQGANHLILARAREMAPVLYDARVTIGLGARDTRGNAVETAKWARRDSCLSLLLITDDYHLPRALLELRRRLPDIPVHGQAVPYVAGRPIAAADLATVAVEYLKYLTSRLRPAW